MKCSNLVTFRTNAKGERVVDRRKTIYTWFANPLLGVEIPEGYETCDGNITVDIKAVEEVHLEHQIYSHPELSIIFTCDQCGRNAHCPEIIGHDEEKDLTDFVNEALSKMSKKKHKELKDKYLANRRAETEHMQKMIEEYKTK